MMNYEALDEALAYLNGDDEYICEWDDSMLPICIILFIAKYVSIMLFAITIFISTGDLIFNDKNRKETKIFFENLNNLAKKYAYYLNKNMPKYGKYISENKIDSMKDAWNQNTKNNSFQICLLKFDIKKFKEDFEINNIEKDQKKLKSILSSIEDEYIDAATKVKDYLNTNGCLGLVDFNLMAVDKSKIEDDITSIMLKNILSDTQYFYLGNITVYYNKDIKKLNISKQIKEKLKFDF